MKKFLIGILLVCSGLSSVKDTNNPSHWIIGKWKMVTVLEGNQDISPVLNPDSNRWFQFEIDGNFQSGEGDRRTNTGTYDIDNQNNTLHIDSDAGEDDDSNWRIQFREDLLYMRGIGTNRQEMTTVISQRVN
ncbi:MAG: hypothetical protein DHS20C17_34390 [Cyclobacteriaceae bacterium]|nr:MAG: hypothetical protein DHS20C17_34390 [Cyclobacteriaceae bacterium]